MDNPFTIQGKNILITGASSGIGRACAIECAKMGANIIVTGRNEERLNDTLNALEIGSHLSLAADLSLQDGIEHIVKNVPELDGLILCAGQGCILPLNFATPDKLKETMHINFESPVELVRLLNKKKKINKNSSIVFISSVGGNFTFPNGGAVYGASKAALSSVMRYFAKELSGKKVRCNCICPGMVETPLITKGTISQEQMEEDIKNNYPLGRYGKPEEIAYAAIYLLSDAAAWITGHNLIIDGGQTIK